MYLLGMLMVILLTINLEIGAAEIKPNQSIGAGAELIQWHLAFAKDLYASTKEDQARPGYLAPCPEILALNLNKLSLQAQPFELDIAPAQSSYEQPEPQEKLLLTRQPTNKNPRGLGEYKTFINWYNAIAHHQAILHQLKQQYEADTLKIFNQMQKCKSDLKVSGQDLPFPSSVNAKKPQQRPLRIDSKRKLIKVHLQISEPS